MKKLFFSVLETISSLLFHAQDLPKILPSSSEASTFSEQRCIMFLTKYIMPLADQIQLQKITKKTSSN